MPNAIRKINQLKTLESFIQINFFKGFEYIDKAGKLINKFYKDDLPPQFSVGLDGLVILKPNDITEELKISADGYWSHYTKPSSLDQVATFYSKYYDDVVNTLGVEKITRIGWRNYFVYEYQKSEERENALKKLNLGSELKIEACVFSLKTNEITSNIIIRRAVRNDSKKTPAILLDIDSFIVFKSPHPVKEGHKSLKEIRIMIQSDDFLKQINLILS